MVQLSSYQNCCSPGICIIHTEVLSRCLLYLQLKLARDSLLSTMNSAITPELMCYVAYYAAYSAPNDKLPKLTFSVIGLYLLNQSYLTL